jgi:dipeptidase E
MCWFEQGLTRSAGAAAPAPGLGLLAGSFSVHRDSEPERLPAFVEAVGAGAIEPGWAVDDGAGIVFSAGHVARVVSARAGAGVSRVELSGGVGVERELEAERLGTPGTRVQQDAAVRELRAVRGMRARGVGARQ